MGFGQKGSECSKPADVLLPCPEQVGSPLVHGIVSVVVHLLLLALDESFEHLLVLVEATAGLLGPEEVSALPLVVAEHRVGGGAFPRPEQISCSFGVHIGEGFAGSERI